MGRSAASCRYTRPAGGRGSWAAGELMGTACNERVGSMWMHANTTPLFFKFTRPPGCAGGRPPTITHPSRRTQAIGSAGVSNHLMRKRCFAAVPGPQPGYGWRRAPAADEHIVMCQRRLSVKRSRAAPEVDGSTTGLLVDVAQRRTARCGLQSASSARAAAAAASAGRELAMAGACGSSRCYGDWNPAARPGGRVQAVR